MTTAALADDQFSHQPWCTDRTIRQSSLPRGWERFRCIGCGNQIKQQKDTK